MFEFPKFSGKLRQTYSIIHMNPGSMLSELNNFTDFNCNYYVYALADLGVIEIQKSSSQKFNGWVCKRVYPLVRVVETYHG